MSASCRSITAAGTSTSCCRNDPRQCADVDQPSAALIRDLEQRGLLDDTLVIWGGEFGRTIHRGPTMENYGRDHHPRCFSMWLAGGGIKQGYVHGETDDFSYNITRDPVHVHDLNAPFSTSSASTMKDYSPLSGPDFGSPMSTTWSKYPCLSRVEFTFSPRGLGAWGEPCP